MKTELKTFIQDIKDTFKVEGIKIDLNKQENINILMDIASTHHNLFQQEKLTNIYKALKKSRLGLGKEIITKWQKNGITDEVEMFRLESPIDLGLHSDQEIASKLLTDSYLEYKEYAPIEFTQMFNKSPEGQALHLHI